MTKIIDLVTVTYNNLMRSFPIDDERYELIECLASFFKDDDSDESFLESVSELGDDRIKSFVIATEENFLLGARAYVIKRMSFNDSGLTSVQLDRARRVEASFAVQPLIDIDWTIDDAAYIVAGHLWGSLIGRVESDRHCCRVST